MPSYKIILKTTNKHSDRVESCLATWLKDLDYVCLTDVLTDKFNEISGTTREDYDSAEEKTVYMINLVKSSGLFDAYDWLVFIDDDAILNVKMFEHIIGCLDKNTVYGLKMCGSFQREPNLLYPSGGSGYFISPSLIKKANKMTNKEWGTEDAAVGKWIQENNLYFDDHYTCDGVRRYLNLNGWFPFPEEYHKMTQEELQEHGGYGAKMLDYVEDHDRKKQQLRRFLTGHYIRNRAMMEYLYSAHESWTPEYL